MTSSTAEALHGIVGPEGQLDPVQCSVGGATPRVAVAPKTVEELSAVLVACAADRIGCLVLGGMSRMACCNPLSRYDVAILTQGLRGFEHHAADMMCTVGAGEHLTAVNENLRATEQWLPWESEFTGPTTVGGAIATDCAGACEDGLGPPRRRVLELLAVTGTGEVIRVGAKVTKHSGGYGLHRLLCGSWGSLAIVAEATMLLAPMPGRRHYRLPVQGWDETMQRQETAERLASHLVSFTLTTEAGALFAEYDVVGDDRTLEWAQGVLGTAPTIPNGSGMWQSAVRFHLDRGRAHELAFSLHGSYPASTIRWRPLSGIVWLLHQERIEDCAPAIAIARSLGATWRAESGATLDRWQSDEGTRRLRDRVAVAFDPNRVLIGEALRGDA